VQSWRPRPPDFACACGLAITPNQWTLAVCRLQAGCAFSTQRQSTTCNALAGLQPAKRCTVGASPCWRFPAAATAISAPADAFAGPLRSVQYPLNAAQASCRLQLGLDRGSVSAAGCAKAGPQPQFPMRPWPIWPVLTGAANFPCYSWSKALSWQVSFPVVKGPLAPSCPRQAMEQTRSDRGVLFPGGCQAAGFMDPARPFLPCPAPLKKGKPADLRRLSKIAIAQLCSSTSR